MKEGVYTSALQFIFYLNEPYRLQHANIIRQESCPTKPKKSQITEQESKKNK